jgi:hypothetical protein
MTQGYVSDAAWKAIAGVAMLLFSGGQVRRTCL